MSKRQYQVSFHEPSLVPLADMLTNTVGILIFILIFTVLAAAAALIPKRLPMEHSTESIALFFVCQDNHVFPFDTSIIEKFSELGRPTSYYDVDNWVKKFNQYQVEDSNFILQGDAKAYYSDNYFRRSVELEARVICIPKEGKGETKDDLNSPNSLFRQSLKTILNKEYFVYFIVYPNSLNVFVSARKIAFEMNFETGWGPHPGDSPIRFSLIGSGRTPVPE